MITTDMIMQAMAVKGAVLAAGLVIFPAIMLWGWAKHGVSPLEVVRELVRR